MTCSSKTIFISYPKRSIHTYQGILLINASLTTLFIFISHCKGYLRLCVGKNSSFKIYKPQVQGTSLCTWGVVRRELCSKYWN